MQEVSNAQRLSRRVAGLKPSGIRKFFDIAATMKDVISLGIGEPDFTTPKPILEAGIRSLQNGETHYTSNAGKLELRQGIAANLEARYGVRYDPAKEIIATCPGYPQSAPSPGHPSRCPAPHEDKAKHPYPIEPPLLL